MEDAVPEGGPAQAIVPLREQMVDFYGDHILAGQTAEGTIYIPLRPLTDFLGLDDRSQRHRVRRDPVLAPEVRAVRMTAEDGKRYSMLCLPLALLPGWLFGVSVNKVRPELREKVLRYQRECFEVLWRAFQNEVLPIAPPPPPDLSPAEQALLLAEAVASLARSHLEQTGRMDVLEQRQQTMADYLRPFVQRTNERLTALELRLSSGATISEDQAAEIALAVKNIAMLLTGAGDANGFGRVWGELYRRFRVGAYRNLPAARFEEALVWLRGWYEELGGAA